MINLIVVWKKEQDFDVSATLETYDLSAEDTTGFLSAIRSGSPCGKRPITSSMLKMKFDCK